MKALGAIAGLVLAVLANGITVKLLWAWFAVPILPVPLLSTPQALGLAVLGGVLAGTTGVKREGSDSMKGGEALVAAILRPLVTLAVGWVVSLFL